MGSAPRRTPSTCVSLRAPLAGHVLLIEQQRPTEDPGQRGLESGDWVAGSRDSSGFTSAGALVSVASTEPCGCGRREWQARIRAVRRM